MKRKTITLSAILIALVLPIVIAQSASALVFYIPSSNPVYGNNNVGVIHVKIDSNNDNTPDKWVETYCIDKDQTISPGQYGASLYSAPDTTINREVAYILSWWHMPGSYSANPGYQPAEDFTKSRATAIQNAIWSFTDHQTVYGTAKTIADDAKNKDIVDEGDTLSLSLVTKTQNSATLKATLTTTSGQAHPNVLVVFKLTGTDTQTGLSTASQWNLPPQYTHAAVTNNQGEIQFTITYSNAPITQVDASTQGIWPNILDPYGRYQNLTPTTYGSSLIVKTAIFVVPEYGLGGLLALSACLAAFVAFKTKRNPRD